MSDTSDRVAQLEKAASDLKSIAKAEEAARAAKEAYREDKSSKNKAAHRKASQKLADLRMSFRSNGAADAAPGDAAPAPDTVAGKVEGE